MPLAAEAAIGWTFDFPFFAPAAQGAEGKKVEEAVERAASHWHQRAEYLLASDSDAFTYEPLPLKPAFSVRVTYRHEGRLKPLPYKSDE